SSTVPDASQRGRLAAMLIRLGAARTAALRDVLFACWSSRLLVWIAGSGAVAVLGFGPVRHAFNPPGVTHGFGWLGDVLAAPVARWDAAWYLVIAHYGYRPEFGAFTAPRDAFFPLYPLGLRALSDIGLAPVIAGVALSIGAFVAALYGLHRLTTLEVARLRRAPLDSREVARLAVLLTAFAPMAFYFSAIYSESLYLALSVGLFLCARRGRWGTAALLGALASATRSTGVVLILPLLLLYLYGPREDREPERETTRRSDVLVAGHALAGRARWILTGFTDALRPRYRLRRDALWLALVPLGLVLYMGHLALAGGDPLAPFHAEAVWKRHFAGPYGGVWDGAKAAFAGLRQLLSFQRGHNYYPVAGGSPFIDAGHNVLLFACLLLAIPMLVGVLRLLPLAYGAYVLAALALPLSYPVAPQPLMSLPRFLLVLFPLNMWLAVTLVSRPRVLTRAVLVLSGLAMAFFVGEFSTWHWVA
ncbi:MAG: mannosyltransferase family protein, partial [Solirubrobacteraceae bacterium]